MGTDVMGTDRGCTTPTDPSAMTAVPDNWYWGVGAAPEPGWALAVMCRGGALGRLGCEPEGEAASDYR